MKIKDSEALVDALGDLGPVGHIRFRNASIQPLRYARETVTDGVRTIVLFTDLSLSEALDLAANRTESSTHVPSLSFRSPGQSGELIEIVQLVVNQEGHGEGSWATGVRIGVNPETGVPGILSSSSVSRLRNVRPAD
jgi:hypothetical protein